MVMMDNQYKWMQYVGLEVLTLTGWSTRGSSSFAPRGSLCHWIAGPANVKPGRRPSLRIIRDGHSTLPGPLSNNYMGRRGEVVLVAAGRCNHAGRGYWMGMTGNSHLMGTEPECAGPHDWTAEQRKSYPLIKIAELFAMWEKGLISWNQIASNRIAGHSEFALPKGRKIDINGYTMTSMRSQIAALIPGFKKRVNRRAIKVGTSAVFDRNTYKFTDGVTAPTPTTDRKSWLDMATKKEVQDAVHEVVWKYKGRDESRDAYSFLRSTLSAVERLEDALQSVPEEVWAETLTNSLMGDNGASATASSWLTNTRRFTREYFRDLRSELSALQNIVEQLSEGEGVVIDYSLVQEAARQGAAQAIEDIEGAS